MTDDYKTSTRNFIRGGQVLLHNYRMIKQLFDRALVFALVVFIGVTIGLTYYRLSSWHRFAVMHWSVAHVLTFFDANSKQKVVVPGSHYRASEVRTIPSADILLDPRVKKAVVETGDRAILSIIYGGLSGVMTLILIFIFLRRRGEKQSEEKSLRGYEIADEKKIKKLLKKLRFQILK